MKKYEKLNIIFNLIDSLRHDSVETQRLAFNWEMLNTLLNANMFLAYFSHKNVP